MTDAGRIAAIEAKAARMRYDIVDPTGIDRLFRLIEQRAGHWLAMQVEHGKIALTEQASHAIDFQRIEPAL